ncbi:hypothetical protein, partial [[Clostridium] scindens]|uniref:hypothetical protein n=1 Tax=Clostridium scindens (strain JCM 10418 / VPI 12708) TaxID=29347 RepID=UPI00241FEB59
ESHLPLFGTIYFPIAPFLCPKMICQNIFPANITTRKFNQGTSYPLLQGGYLAIPAYSIQEVKDLPYPACGADMAKSFVRWYCQY